MGASIDLHLHTTASDGSCTPTELAVLLRQQGIHTFAITDHDTVAGAAEMLAHAPGGMRFIPGVEFSCRSGVGRYHILGYGIHPEDPLLLAAIEEGRQLRLGKLELRLAHLRNTHGITFTEDEVLWLRSRKSPGKPHLGRLLLSRGLGNTMMEVLDRYINPFKGGNDRIDAEPPSAPFCMPAAFPSGLIRWGARASGTRPRSSSPRCLPICWLWAYRAWSAGIPATAGRRWRF